MSLPVEMKEPVAHRRIRQAVWTMAVAAGLVALGQTMFSLALARRPATSDNLALAERWLLRPELRLDWQWLQASGLPAGATVAEWLDTVELAALQRRQFYEALPERAFREHVLSPQLKAGEALSGALRRQLWRHFAPRVRKAEDPATAAAMIARELRARVTPQAGAMAASLPVAWARGAAHPDAWEALYVAGLRSAGIAARMGEAGRAELWLGFAWQAAPRPPFDS